MFQKILKGKNNLWGKLGNSQYTGVLKKKEHKIAPFTRQGKCQTTISGFYDTVLASLLNLNLLAPCGRENLVENM